MRQRSSLQETTSAMNSISLGTVARNQFQVIHRENIRLHHKTTMVDMETCRQEHMKAGC